MNTCYSASAKLKVLASLPPAERVLAAEQLVEEIAGPDGRPSLERPNILSPYSRDVGTFNPVDLSEFPEPAPAPMLWGERLAVGYPNTLYGNGGQGKSILALALAASVAAGQRFCGLELPTGPVFYLDWELSQDAQLRRAYQVARGLGLEAPPKGLLYLAPMDCLPSLIDQAAQVVAREKPVLIVVDSMGPASGGNPEAAEETITLFNAIRRLGVSSLILDHQAKMQAGHDYKNKTIFGSAYKFNLSRSVLHLERISSVPGELRLLVRHAKSNFGPYAEDLALLVRFSVDTVKFEAVDQHTDPAFVKALKVGEKLLASLQKDGPATSESLADRIGEELKTVKNEITRLRKSNRIEETGKENRQTLWALCQLKVPTSHVYTAGLWDDQDLSSENIEARVVAMPQHERARYFAILDRLDGPTGDPATIKQQAWAEFQRPC